MTALTVLVVFGALWVLFSALLFWTLCYAGARRNGDCLFTDLPDWPKTSLDGTANQFEGQSGSFFSRFSIN